MDRSWLRVAHPYHCLLGSHLDRRDHDLRHHDLLLVLLDLDGDLVLCLLGLAGSSRCQRFSLTGKRAKAICCGTPDLLVVML